MNKNLIIDVGMHAGKDTAFYLRKGFNVVAIEANPALAAKVQSELADYISRGRLTIYNVAIAPYDGEVQFYANDRNDTWGTISKEFADRNARLGSSHTVIKVKCMPFRNIIRNAGVPYYLKIDVEGMDIVCMQDLLSVPDRPKYISIEAGLNSFEETFTELSVLWQLGYRQFKIVNQMLNSRLRLPNPPLEGDYVDHCFEGACSGPFGEETPGVWMDIEETFVRFRRLLREQKFFGANGKLHRTVFRRMYEMAKRAPVGWYDFHARLGNPDV